MSLRKIKRNSMWKRLLWRNTYFKTLLMYFQMSMGIWKGPAILCQGREESLATSFCAGQVTVKIRPLWPFVATVPFKGIRNEILVLVLVVFKISNYYKGVAPRFPGRCSTCRIICGISSHVTGKKMEKETVNKSKTVKFYFNPSLKSKHERYFQNSL